MSRAAAFSPFQRTPLDRLRGRWTLDYSPAFIATDLMARLVSPYALGGAGESDARHPGGGDRLRPAKPGRSKLFITATNVRTGRGRVFRRHEITPDVLLASACLPTMFQAVEIDGEPYWDGGFSGNPTLTPWSSRATRRTPSSCRSTRSSGRGRRAAPARSRAG